MANAMTNNSRPLITEEEYNVLVRIFAKTKAEVLPTNYDAMDALLENRFTKFLAAQPLVIKTLLEAKADGRTKVEIENFLEDLTNVNATLAEIKECRDLLYDIRELLYEFYKAEYEYEIQPQLEAHLNL